MFFISVRRKTLGLIAIAIIVCLIAVSIYSITKVAHNENKYQSVLNITRMFDDTHFIAYITDEKAQKNNNSIEVFDISKGEVVIREPMSAEIKNEVTNYLKSIKSLYTKVIPFPEKGYVIRVPFEPPLNVKLKLINDVGIKTLDSVYVILSDKEAPILLVLDSQRKPYFFTFDSSVQPLLDYVKLNPQEKAMESEDAESQKQLETISDQ